MYDYVEFIIEFVAHLSDYSLANESKTNNNKKKEAEKEKDEERKKVQLNSIKKISILMIDF